MTELLVAIGGPRSFVGAASLVRCAEQRGLGCALLEAGAPYETEVSRALFQELGLRAPDVYLRGRDGGQALRRIDPATVVVVGEAESALAFALLAARAGRPVGRLDAGLRREDGRASQRVDLKLCDHASAYLFTSAAGARATLLREGIPASRVFFVGNPMADTLPWLCGPAPPGELGRHLGLEPGSYVVATFNGRENVDEYLVLAGLVEALLLLSRCLPVVFPVHARTEKQLNRYGLRAILQSEPGIRLCAERNYVDFVRLCAGARVVVSDSRGVEEEATILGVPCITLRESSNRPVTVLEGTNHLAGNSAEEIVERTLTTIETPRRPAVPELWDGEAGARIADILAAGLGRQRSAVSVLA